MKITRQRHEDGATLKPCGPLTGDDAEQLRRAAESALQDGAAAIVIDVSGVPFADSRGLEVLVELAEHALRTGGTLRLAGANDLLREVLDLTELTPMFDLIDGVDPVEEVPA